MGPSMYSFIGILAITLIIISLANPTEQGPEETELKDGENQQNPCEGIVCAESPGSKCQSVYTGKSGIEKCCPDFECRDADGTISMHSGIAGGGTKGSTTYYTSPDGSKGVMKTHSSSSFSSGSSGSAGPGAMNMNSLNFQMPKPPTYNAPPGFLQGGQMQIMSPFSPMLPMGYMGPQFMGPPVGFYNNNMPKPAQWYSQY